MEQWQVFLALLLLGWLVSPKYRFKDYVDDTKPYHPP